MIRKKLLLFSTGLILFFGLTGQIQAQNDSVKADSVATEAADKDKNPYLEIVNNAEKSAKGMFNIFYTDDKLYFEIPFDLLNKDMLLSSTISKISNNKLGTVGAKPHPPLWLKFSKVDSVLLLWKVHKNSIAAKDNSSIVDAINKNSIGSILKKFDIEAYNKNRTSAIIDVTDYFIGDIERLSPIGGLGMHIARGYSYDKAFKGGRSFIGGFDSFEDNLTIKSHLSYEYTLKNGNRVIEKNQPFTAVMTRTLLLLPETPMRPRVADPRIGIFTTGKRKYSESGGKSEVVHYARRFRLKPKDVEAYMDGELTEPVTPIIFYVDNDFPKSWKKSIKEAITDWNVAFEKIGFKNAIVARDYPENDPEFNPDNLKYNVVRYSPTPVQNAMGPSWIDPRSGEILNASVYVYHDIVRLINNWRFIQTSPADKAVRNVELPKAYKMNGIRYVIRHEIGHTLGFAHNMAGSSSIPVDSLRSPTFTQKHGTTYSIMDYARYNYVAQPGDKERGVQLTPPKFGIYDYYLVKWNYAYFSEELSTEEVSKKLTKLVDNKADDIRFRYGRQGLAMDPRSLMEDLGNDAVKASKLGIKNLKYVMNHLNEWVGDEDIDFTYRQSIWNGIVIQYIRYINHLFTNVGGIYLNEKFAGDPLPHFRSVPSEKQEEALLFLFEQVKNLDWLENEEVLINMPLTGNISALLREAITKALLTAPLKVNLSALKSEEKNPYSPAEAMEDIYEAVWSKTDQNKVLNKNDKYLQEAYVESILKGSNLAAYAEGNQIAFQSSFFSFISVPDLIKKRSIENFSYGIYKNYISPLEYGKAGSVSASFSGTSIHFNVMPSLESIYYAYLLKVKTLLEEAIAQAPDMETEVHYKLLLHKIEKSIR